MKDRSFEKSEETYAQGFCERWELDEPLGYDHPDTFEPIAHTFENADKEINELKTRNRLLDASGTKWHSKMKIALEENQKLKERIAILEKYKKEPYEECVRLQNCNLKLGRDNKKLKECLEVYAKGDHYHGDDWENPSGEPLNILCLPIDLGHYIEDGSIARHCLKDIES